MITLRVGPGRPPAPGTAPTRAAHPAAADRPLSHVGIGSRVAIDDRCSGHLLVRPSLLASEGPAA